MAPFTTRARVSGLLDMGEVQAPGGERVESLYRITGARIESLR